MNVNVFVTRVDGQLMQRWGRGIERSMSTKSVYRRDLRLFRYGTVACAVWLLDLLVFWLIYVHLPLFASVFVSRAAGGLLGFVLHRAFSFGVRTKTNAREVMAYTGLWTTNYLLTVGGVAVSLEMTPLGGPLSKVIADALVFGLNYLILSKIFIGYGPRTESPKLDQ